MNKVCFFIHYYNVTNVQIVTKGNNIVILHAFVSFQTKNMFFNTWDLRVKSQINTESRTHTGMQKQNKLG
jgi:hypothetical protein